MKKLTLFILFCLYGASLYGKDLIGELILVGFNGTDSKEILNKIKSEKIGGVVLFERNIESSKSLMNLTQSLKTSSKKPILIAIDQEGGLVARLNKRNGFEEFPSANEVASLMNLEETKELYAKMAKYLKEFGINYNLAPVVDLKTKNPIGLKNRTYSSSPSLVSLYAGAFVDGFDSEGVLTSLKHFPGLGNAKVDTHDGKSDGSSTWQYEELQPFFDLIKSKKARSIMVSHLYVDKFDKKYPASLSKKIITSLLKEELKYDGLVISDDLLMSGISNEFSLKDRVILALNAGVDILLFSQDRVNNEDLVEKVHEIVNEALKDGSIKKEQLESANRKVKAFKRGINGD